MTLDRYWFEQGLADSAERAMAKGLPRHDDDPARIAAVATILRTASAGSAGIAPTAATADGACTDRDDTSAQEAAVQRATGATGTRPRRRASAPPARSDSEKANAGPHETGAAKNAPRSPAQKAG